MPNNAPLRIAMVAPCPFPTRQGTQVFLRHLCHALSGRGHALTLFSYEDREHDAAMPFRVVRAGTAGTLRSGPTLRRPIADLVFLRRCLAELQVNPADVLHVHNAEGLVLGLVLRQALRIPLVYHAHNAMGPELPTYFARAAAKRAAAAIGCGFDRAAPRLADVVIAFDTRHTEYLRACGVSDARMVCIPPGTDPDELNGLQRPNRPRHCLLYAGNADNYQNIPLLWDALRVLRIRRPDTKLLIATRSAADFVIPQDIGAAVVVRECRTLEALRTAFRDGDVGVCPRALWTGVPIKVLSYLSAGLPVVACRSAVRMLEPDEGRCVAAEPDAFASACADLLDTPPANPRHAERFRIEHHVPQYEAAYARALRRIDTAELLEPRAHVRRQRRKTNRHPRPVASTHPHDLARQ